MTRYLRTAEAAEYLGVSPRTLEKWRLHGGGPHYCRPPGRHVVRYAVADLDRWLGAGRRRSTSDPAHAATPPAAGL
jgi:excisionase family DNA binding protein